MRNRKIRIIIPALIVAVGLSACGQNSAASNKVPETQEEYVEKREELAAENNYQTSVTLSEDEKRTDAALTEMKKAYIQSCGGEVPYDMPVLEDEISRRKVKQYQDNVEQLKLEKLKRITYQFVMPQNPEKLAKILTKEEC